MAFSSVNVAGFVSLSRRGGPVEARICPINGCKVGVFGVGGGEVENSVGGYTLGTMNRRLVNNMDLYNR